VRPITHHHRLNPRPPRSPNQSKGMLRIGPRALSPEPVEGSKGRPQLEDPPWRTSGLKPQAFFKIPVPRVSGVTAERGAPWQYEPQGASPRTIAHECAISAPAHSTRRERPNINVPNLEFTSYAPATPHSQFNPCQSAQSVVSRPPRFTSYASATAIAHQTRPSSAQAPSLFFPAPILAFGVSAFILFLVLSHSHLVAFNPRFPTVSPAIHQQRPPSLPNPSPSPQSVVTPLPPPFFGPPD